MGASTVAASKLSALAKAETLAAGTSGVGSGGGAFEHANENAPAATKTTTIL
jgi:hypothetical protein